MVLNLVIYKKRELSNDEGCVLGPDELALETGLSRTAAGILCLRGINTPERADAFLNAGIEALHDPFLLEDMREAVDGIKAAIEDGEKIAVYGDYDADGVCAAASLTMFLLSIGADAGYYIPGRQSEGYGLNAKAVENLAERGTGLIITVDCGITAVEEAELCADLGIGLIVTDHHQCPDTLPECIAVVNPHRGGYPDNSLCGAGVAGKLIQAIGGLDALMRYIDIIALATVADIVPLVGENRVLVKIGLDIMNTDPRPGISAISDVSGVGKNISASDIAFAIAPRINAGGRMGRADRAVKMLMAEDYKEATAIAAELDEDNRARQLAETSMLDDALALISEQCDIVSDAAIVVSSKYWNSAVAGIVAARIGEQYHMPTLVLCEEDGICTGSGRSIKGIDIYAALKPFERLFTRFGGHEQAVGLTMSAELVPELRDGLNKHLKENYDAGVFIKTKDYDMKCSVSELDSSLALDLSKLEPFGTGNPQPVFLVSEAQFSGGSLVGRNGAHYKAVLNDKTAGVDSIAFRMGDIAPRLDNGRIETLVTLGINEWNGRKKPQCIIKSVKRQCSLEDYLPLVDMHAPDMAQRARPALEFSKDGCDISEAFADLTANPKGTVIAAATPWAAKSALNAIFLAGAENYIDMMPVSSSIWNRFTVSPAGVFGLGLFNKVYVLDFVSADFMQAYEENIRFVKWSEKDREAAASALRLDRDKLLEYYFSLSDLLKTQALFRSRGEAMIKWAKGNDAYSHALALVIFEELGLVEARGDSDGFTLHMIKSNGQKNLEDSTSLAHYIQISDMIEKLI